jgi:hypothetical protein
MTARATTREWLLSELLNKVTGKKKQQLISDQQDGERYRQHAHAQQLARGYLCGQRTPESRGDCRNFHGAKLNRRKRVTELDYQPIRRASAKANEDALGYNS